MTRPLRFIPLALVLAAFVAASLFLARGARGQSSSAQERAVHLLQRATYGPRPEDVAQVLERGIDGWLAWQTAPGAIDDSALKRWLADYPAAAMSPADLIAAYPRPRRPAAGDSVGVERSPRARRPARIVADLAGARLLRAAGSERQLEAVMTDFWFNHFNVYWGKGPARWLVPDYERAAIRPHVFGRFEDLLAATAAHPAMLVYLDNARSVAPDSSGRRSGPRRPRGLNENYARELLELHTLGLDGGYTQADVVAVARAFTGWTVTGAGRGGRGAGPAPVADPAFAFRAALHDQGAKTVLGHALPAGRGIEDGQDVLAILARHPATARHVATRLAETFVADDPPAGLVERLAATFRQTDGDLRAVTIALFGAPELHDPAVAGSKVKSPFELVASALRQTRAEVGPSRALLETLRAFDHVPYLESAPTGYPTTDPEWVSGGAMLQRMNFALALANGAIEGVGVDPARVGAADAADPVTALAAALVPATDVDRLVAVIRADLAGFDGSPEERGRRALGLVLGSSEFQRH